MLEEATMQKQILIIEDDADSSAMLSNMVELVMHHKATPVYDGEKAVRIVQKGSFDIILLDLELPGLGGLDVARALRQIKHCQTTPIIATTGHDLASVQRKAAEAGCNECIMKPITVKSLVEVLSKYGA
jgi:CheY-like chemotaxis protein